MWNFLCGALQLYCIMRFSVYRTQKIFTLGVWLIRQWLLTRNLFSKLSRPFFYAQFVGGDTEKELAHTAKILLDSKVRLMVCPVQVQIARIAEGGPSAWELPTCLLASPNGHQQRIVGKKSGQLANLKKKKLVGKLAERGAESSLWNCSNL